MDLGACLGIRPRLPFRERAVEQLTPASSAQPGVRVAAEKLLVHGQQYLCVLKYSASFAGEQLHGLTTSLSKVLQALRRLAMDLNKPHARGKEIRFTARLSVGYRASSWRS